MTKRARSIASWTYKGKGSPKAVAHAKSRRSASQAHKKGSPGEELLAFQLKALKIEGWQREYHFHPMRQWRVDFAFLSQRLAVEIEGGHWSGGRHTRGSGFERDIAKYNALVIDGWRLLRFTSAMVKSGDALTVIRFALRN